MALEKVKDTVAPMTLLTGFQVMAWRTATMRTSGPVAMTAKYGYENGSLATCANIKGLLGQRRNG